MAILAELQHEGWCEDKSAPACLKEDLVYLQKRRALPAKSIQAIYDCFFGLPVCQECQHLLSQVSVALKEGLCVHIYTGLQLRNCRSF